MPATLAIAMAVYNEERFLPAALDGLCAQTWRDFSLTILDDGSTDRSAQIAAGYQARLPMILHRAEHRGLQATKRALVELAAQDSRYLMILDADIALPPDAVERMVAMLDRDPSAGVVCAQARPDRARPWGGAQAFMEDVFRRATSESDETWRWIVGACAMFRRDAIRHLRFEVALPEDADLAERLREQWKILAPLDLVATHWGVPTTLRGIVKRSHREGVRVMAVLRTHPRALQVSHVARLVPLPLAVAGLLALVFRRRSIAVGSSLALLSYGLAFLVVGRRAEATLGERLSGTLAFTIGNIGYGIGFLREAIVGGRSFREPARPTQ